MSEQLTAAERIHALLSEATAIACNIPLSEAEAIIIAQDEVWAPWHPVHGFSIQARHYYEGPTTFADLDGALPLVKMLNLEDRTTNRNGWRAVPCKVVRVPRR
ncbi:hypothetical protein ABIF38_006396 [Bradyrhizobium japonicum]|uniref:hypothetical protein n=1 Tax=Bradyrhizobium elkanii TaxID=29448 RepID=UPI00059E1177|nr:hypothetical protein [Bradyrhizobium elkanii]WAX24327.1 hypothetical protein [Bradyrhizobium phage ppBeUSDA76-1]MCP1731296.1 hypothetical protein [Bradyrhizobium elkanii]MCS3575425.1 hypothetical protein [Bradyrhizobium elkanii]MCS3591884.1 hypothetical protein [Bradyrhizobium elkanii]MCS3621329.1 hypothetical protein [Bradyrhizobium elkanii]